MSTTSKVNAIQDANRPADDFDEWAEHSGSRPRNGYGELVHWFRTHPKVLTQCVSAEAKQYRWEDIAAYAYAQGCPPRSDHGTIRKAVKKAQKEQR
jgi:hypothetical protein